MEARDIFLLSFICQGTLVLFSYCVYWPDDEAMWAGLKDPCVFYIWCVSASLSAVGFCSFSVEMILSGREGDVVYGIATLPYTCFLMSAALYMPLATAGYKLWTMVVLFLAAVATCVLVYCSVLLFGWSWVTVLMCVLAFHCTVIDFIFWGFTWTNGVEGYSGV